MNPPKVPLLTFVCQVRMQNENIFLLPFVVFLYKIQSPYCNEQANA